MTCNLSRATLGLRAFKLALVLLLPLTAHADSVVQVTVSNATFIGNSSCSNGLCSEVFNGQYSLDITTDSVLPGASMLATGTLGTLPNFSLFAGSTSGACPDGSCPVWVGAPPPVPYVWLVWDNPTTPYPALGSYSISLLFLECEAADICLVQFTPITVATSGTITVTAVPGVPEPSTLMLLGTGAAGLLGTIRRKLSA